MALAISSTQTRTSRLSARKTMTSDGDTMHLMKPNAMMMLFPLSMVVPRRHVVVVRWRRGGAVP